MGVWANTHVVKTPSTSWADPVVEPSEEHQRLLRLYNRKLCVPRLLFDSFRWFAAVLFTDEWEAAAAGSLSANTKDFPLIIQPLLLLQHVNMYKALCF